ncbi:uncharacterized protein C8Q71DRAFT_855201 [Rhodofomes roseus]|uniref:RanBP2-type domain-containing protein n=1 Tax=Rhodofomes roseus TaxID=34475 RepID=A0ABQ8KNA3_9APHY|nr:uncharacterized protein C8Q71DRAFT_855201 [Rhodofomes roseus]KAH9839894.1 hypothetical protein C8Q71DRAFT_855201 [Rhodofomes roseus]
MSGVARSNPSASRRAARKHAALPYSRPAPKKSSWGWTDVFSFLNPLRALSPSRDGEEEEEEEEANEPVQSTAARALSIRGREMLDQRTYASSSSGDEQRPASNAPSAPTAAQPQLPSGSQATTDTTNPSSLLDHLISQGSNNKAVEEFLRSKGDQPLTRIEYAGVLALLAGRVEAEPEDKLEPFRFSTSPLSPEPAQATFTPGSASNGNRKMLTKNPNGPYLMRGGGSARPRNRYQSPGFGPPQRTTPPIRITPEKPPADGKRRRIGADPDLFAPRPVSSVTASSSYARNGATSPVAGPSSTGTRGDSTANGLPKVNRASPTTPVRRPAKATAPVNPSPLRQAWGQPDSPPSQSSPPSTSKQTSSAAYLSQLIKDISPKTNPDIQNPYQAASMLPRPPAKKPPPKKPRGADAAKPAPKPAAAAAALTAAEPALTPVETIEATMPTGSKRARPVPDIRPIATGEATSSSAGAAEPPTSRRTTRIEAAAGTKTNGFSAKVSVVYEGVDEEEEGSPQKKQKTTKTPAPPTNGLSRRRPPPVEIVEVLDEDEPSGSQVYTLPSEVIEPDESSKSAARSASLVTAPSSTRVRAGSGSSQDRPHDKFKPARPSGLRHQVSMDDEEAPEDNAKPAPVPSAPKPSLPSLVPAAKPIAQKKAHTPPRDAKAIALAKSANDLPTYSFTIPSTPLDVSRSAKDRVRAMRPAELPVFDLKTALSSPGAGPSTSAGSRAGDVGKSTGGSSSSQGFNWEAAGMAKPAPKAEGSWTCSACMCTNDAKATEKCAICEAPHPSAPKAQPVGFNWDAAKLVKPKAKEGSWTCSMCLCSNGPDVEEKCSVCEAPRPR